MITVVALEAAEEKVEVPVVLDLKDLREVVVEGVRVVLPEDRLHQEEILSRKRWRLCLQLIRSTPHLKNSLVPRSVKLLSRKLRQALEGGSLTHVLVSGLLELSLVKVLPRSTGLLLTMSSPFEKTVKNRLTARRHVDVNRLL